MYESSYKKLCTFVKGYLLMAYHWSNIPLGSDRDSLGQESVPMIASTIMASTAARGLLVFIRILRMARILMYMLAVMVKCGFLCERGGVFLFFFNHVWVCRVLRVQRCIVLTPAHRARGFQNALLWNDHVYTFCQFFGFFSFVDAVYGPPPHYWAIPNRVNFGNVPLSLQS